MAVIKNKRILKYLLLMVVSLLLVLNFSIGVSASPADINAFGSQAKTGSIYVEFDVDSSKIYQAGNDGWGQIPGPGSLYDRLNIKKGLPPIEDIPNAYNIKIGGEK